MTLRGVPVTSAVGAGPFAVSADVTNAGPSDLAVGEATLTLSIPTGLSFSTPSACTSSATTMSCPVGALAANGTWTSPAVMVSGSRPPGTRPITASVATADVGQDPEPANDSDSDSVAVVIATDLSPTLSGLPTSVEVGTAFPVLATVSNAGPSDLAAGEATVTFSLGTGLAVTGALPTGCSTVAATVTCPIAPLTKDGAGDTAPFSVVGNEPSDSTVTATVSTVSAGQDAVTGNNVSSVPVKVFSPPSASLSPSSLDFGEQLIGSTSVPRTVTVTNSGGAPLQISGVATTGDFSVDPASTCTSASTVAPGASCAVALTFTPSTTGTRTGTLTVTDNAAGNPRTVPLTGTGTLRADLAVSMSANPNPVKSGSKLTYRITVLNTGPTAATKVSLSDVLPPDTQFVSLMSPGWTCTAPAVGSTGTLTCALNTTLATSATATVDITVKVVAGGGRTVNNTASVRADSPDPDTANNTVTVATAVFGRR